MSPGDDSSKKTMIFGNMDVRRLLDVGCDWRDQVLTHLALLRPALQAWRGYLGWRAQVLTHLALLKPALQAWRGVWARCWRRGVVLCFVLRSFAIQA